MEAVSAAANATMRAVSAPAHRTPFLDETHSQTESGPDLPTAGKVLFEGPSRNREGAGV